MSEKIIKVPPYAFAEWLRKQRINNNLSQAELARKLHGKVSARTLTNIEKAKQTNYREDTLINISKELGIEFNEFINAINLLVRKKDVSLSSTPSKHIFDSFTSAPYDTAPALKSDFPIICEIAKNVYKGIDIIPYDIMLSWYFKNPAGFTIIKDRKGQICGNLDILPLKPDILDKFLDGKIIEQEIDADSLYSPEERERIEMLYVESFVAVTDKFVGNPLAAYKCLMQTVKIVERIANPRNIKRIYAIAASESGIELLQHLSFNKIENKESRKDNHNLYFVDFFNLAKNIMDIAETENKNKLMLFLNNLEDSTL